MATEPGAVAAARKLTAMPHLVVEDDALEMAKKAAWSVSSWKPGNGVLYLLDDNLDTYWQSDGPQPHVVNIQFQKKVKLQVVVLYVDFKLDQSYTPSKISIRAGDSFHNLKETKIVDLVKPIGWVHISLSGNDPRETFIRTFVLQIAVLSNHLNGRDTHIRQIKIYGPQLNCLPHQPFHFTSKEFISYSNLRSIHITYFKHNSVSFLSSSFASSPTPSYTVMALEAFRNAIYEDPLSRLSDWNPHDEHPCNWNGVKCSGPPHISVISINLSNSSLKGFLAPQLGTLHWLQELVLNDNLLLGSIPYQLSLLSNLVVLDLSINKLSGPIPPEIGNLTSITKIDLHSNRLTGSIPLELGELVNLREIRLDRNKLNGVIPGSNASNMLASQINGSGLCQLTNLGVGDFSFNYLVGKIPSCLNYLPRPSFGGNCFDFDGSIFQRSAQECSLVNSQDPTKGAKSNRTEGFKHNKPSQPLWLLILEIATGSLLLVFLIACMATACSRCKRKSSVISWRKIPSWNDRRTLSIDPNLLKDVMRINYQEIEASCEDFSNIIGSSLHSIVYKGTMKNGPEIAVISLCIPADQWTSSHELCFQREVADLSRVNHENTAKLLGYCQEHHPFSRMLVFEYASNGTLYEHIHYGDGCQLSWLRRMKIAIGVARGLRYLHTELQPPITIAKLTSSAVYLTEDFSPKLVDLERWNSIFSMSKVHSGHFMNGSSLNGCEDSHKVQLMDVQENIYAFGVIVLELISGRPLHCKQRGSLLDWAMKYLVQPGEREKVIDPELKKVKPEDLAIICNVVSLCLQSEPSKRPSMQILAAMLEDGIDITVTAVLKESSLAWAELTI
ncbi:putative LRR receptor-like serine/threonine-protein kinase [Canna indica]|uniref:LRR receptor-like serine/threonine-protein kinase n=1 Tax=Canna indica TaxID=4628 RepID=A0AAQ3KCA2_9LILI|nr:putative LRR receptor-like serine/threonine-protein kinase [Canna indica]